MIIIKAEISNSYKSLLLQFEFLLLCFLTSQFNIFGMLFIIDFINSWFSISNFLLSLLFTIIPKLSKKYLPKNTVCTQQNFFTIIVTYLDSIYCVISASIQFNITYYMIPLSSVYLYLYLSRFSIQPTTITAFFSKQIKT